MRIYFRHGLYRAEKDATGRASLINVGTPGLVAKVANSPIIWSIAHHEKNYTVSEYNAVVFATPSDLAVAAESWLYVDLDLSSGKKTYGVTITAPSYGLTAPTAPVDDQHWFDLNNNTTKVYSSATKTWHERVRLVFGHWNGVTFTGIDYGSSVGVSVAAGTNSGSIIYDATGRALKDSRGRFVTAVDKMFSDGAATHQFMLESNITRATANENIPAFHVVRWVDFDTVELANYADTSDSVVAITLSAATKGNPVELCIQGKVINDAWQWTNVNATLWINKNGEFSTVDPYDLQSHTKRRVPVARVLDRNTIVFEQGLGGVGEKGEPGDLVGLFDASDVVKGITKLSVAPTDPSNPIAVAINDPILSAPRVPLEHGHPATQVTVSSFGGFTQTNAQQALLYLFNAKLETTGGTVTGAIKSTVSATAPDHLTTLADVDAKIRATQLQIKRLDLTSTITPTLTQAFNALSAASRTFGLNEVVFVTYNKNVYVWLGGSGVVTAANDDQFAWIGKIDFEIPETEITVKAFVGTMVVLPPSPPAEELI